GFRIDGSQLTVWIGLDPGDVVADGPHLPAFEAFGRDHHGEIRFSASTRESRSNVGFFAMRIFEAEDEHVLSHPSFITRNIRGDSQRETLLTKQGIAAISGAVRPDFSRLGKMDDVFLVVARPRYIALPRR